MHVEHDWGARILFGHTTDKPTLSSIQKDAWDDFDDDKPDAENIGRNTHRKEDNTRSKCQVNMLRGSSLD